MSAPFPLSVVIVDDDEFVAQSLRTILEARGNVRVAALGTTIDLSRELVRMRRKAFAEGMATSTEVVDAEVMLSKVRIAVLLAYYEYDVALANLLSLCGAPERFERYSLCGRTESHLFGPDGLYGENEND